MDLSPGSVVAGRYRVDTRVGSGGMGEVWAGEHLAVGLRVAVKTLLPAVAVNHEIVARFKREAYLLGRVRSEHVARVVDFVADDVFGLVLVMEYVEGSSLSSILQTRRLAVEEAIDLAYDLCKALSDLHRANVVHRDLKPGNIMLTPQPSGELRAVVVDFGVSRQISSGSNEDEELTAITRVDMAVGTLEYMAPEQILNSRNVTPASDLYAAGAILFRGIAGAHVYGDVGTDAVLAQKKLTVEAPPLPTGRTDPAAQGLAEVTAKLLRRRPSERYTSAEEVLADLEPLRERAKAVAVLRAEIDAPAAGSNTSAPPRATGVTVVTAKRSVPPLASGSPNGVPVLVLVAAVLGSLLGGVLLAPTVFKLRDSPRAKAPAPAARASASSAPSSNPPHLEAGNAVAAAPSVSATAAAPANAEVTDEAPTEKPGRTVAITVAKGGALYFNAEFVDEKALITRLRRAHATSPDLTVVVAGDPTVAHGQVVRVVGLARAEGITKCSVNPDGPSPPSPLSR